MADEPKPNGDQAKGDKPGDQPTDGKPAKSDETEGSAGTGRSLGSVVASGRLTNLANGIASAVASAAESRRILVVEDRTVAESDLPLQEVKAALRGLNDTMTLIGQAVRAAPGPPTGVPRRLVRVNAAIESEDEVEAGEASEAEASEGEGEGDAETASFAPGDAIKQVAEILDLFKSTFEIAAQDVAVDRTALMAAVTGAIQRQKPPKDVRWPSLASARSAEIFTKARRVARRRQLLVMRVDRLASAWSPVTLDVERRRARRDKLVSDHDALLKEGKTSEAALLEPEIRDEELQLSGRTSPEFLRVTAIIATARSALADVGTRLGALALPGPAGRSPLQAAASRQHLKSIGGDDWAVLWLDVTAMGGDRTDRSSPLGWNSEVSYLGGVQATYLLVDKDGPLLAAGAPTSFGFRTFDFESFYDASGTDPAWRPPRLLNIELIEVIVVVVVLILILLIIGEIFA